MTADRTLSGSFPERPRPTGLHVGIIMDGNGRWAQMRGHRRVVGHRIGGRSVRAVVEAAPALGIGTLTLYAFSSDNWKRPAAEVRALFRLFKTYLRTQVDRCVQEGVRLQVIGERSRLPDHIRVAIDEAQERTARGDRLRLRVAIDYSSRNAILKAARAVAEGADPDAFAARLADAIHDPEPCADLDFLIRTGGDRRLSDFLLWEAAYAELYFTDTPWPDFDGSRLDEAMKEFRGRERRFGQVGARRGRTA
jgi:undecaprenyl diphosphate synthase